MGERQPAAPPGALEPGEDPERLRVPLEPQEILPLALAEPVHEARRGLLRKVLLDRGLADVAEWGVAEVVRETGGRDTVTQVARIATLGERHPLRSERPADERPERAPDRRHLEAVREPRVNVVIERQREHLCLVREPAERTTEQDSVVVALERRARG